MAQNYFTMKTIKLSLLLLLCSLASFAQVGIGNTDPKASLDITSSNLASPANTDGILIPRIDNFPSTNPAADQDGMMVFVTGNGTPTKGFYYWDNGNGTWVNVLGVRKINDLEDAKSDNDGSDDGSSIYIGENAGSNDDQSNNNNVGLGKAAMNSNTSGNYNIGIGFQSLLFNTTGVNNTAVGTQSLLDNNGDFNTAVGTYAINNNIGGDSNTAVGWSALSSIVNGNGNTAIGNNAGFGVNGNSSNNIFIGNHSGYKMPVGSRSGSIFIGYFAGSGETNNNRLYIENSNADENNALIYGEFDSNLLRTNGEFQIGNPSTTGYALPTTDGANGQILGTDGAGQINFINPSSIFTDNTNTLDQAYDQSVPSPNQGATIVADNGPVSITGGDGFNVRGDFGASGSVVLAPPNDKSLMFFNPFNAVFRAGFNEGTDWIYSNQGDYSIALGYSPLATGERTFATGSLTQATGDRSTAMGNGTIAASFAETAIGNFNTDYTPDNTSAFDPDDRLLVIGNGTSDVARQNALTIYKSGLLNINDEYNMPLTDGTNGQVMTTDGAGNISFQNQTSDSDWYEEGTSASPNDINDNIFTHGNVGIGDTTPIAALDINYTGSQISGMSLDYSQTSATGGYGQYITAETTSSSAIVGSSITVRNSNSSSLTTASSIANTANGDNNTGISTLVNGNGDNNIGIYTNVSGASDENIGGLFTATSGAIVNTGILASATGGTINWAGHFGVVGSNGSGNVYVNDKLEVASAFQYTDGNEALGYVLSTDANGNANWVDPSTVFTNTDNQNLTAASLTGTTLNLGIQNGTGTSIDLGSLQDGTGTDNQTIETFNFNSGTNILTLEIEDDGVPAQTVDLSSISSDHDWYVQPGTNLPSDINDNIYTLGSVGIGNTSSSIYKLYVDSASGHGTYFTGTGTTDHYTLNVINTQGRAARFQTGGSFFSGYSVNNVALQAIAHGNNAVAGFFTSYDSGEAIIGQSLGSGTAIEGWANGTGLSGYFHGGQLYANDGFRAEGNVVINDNGYSTSDFRVESDTEPYMLFVDAGNNFIGIGNNNPQTELHVDGDFRVDNELQIGNPATTGYALPTLDGTNGQVLTTDGAGNVTFQDAITDTDNQTIDNIGLTGTVLGISLEDDGLPMATVDLAPLQDGDNQQIDSFSFNSVTNELTLEIEDDGQAAQTVDLSSLNPQKAAAHITLSTDQTNSGSGTTKVLFDTEGFDIGNNFDTSSDVFIAPADGIYRVSAQIAINSSTSTGTFDIRIRVDGSQVRIASFNHSGSGNIIRQINSLIELTAGQTIDIAYQRAIGVTINSNNSITYFDIEQL